MASALRAVPGVTGVQVDWREGRGQVIHETAVSSQALVQAVEAAHPGPKHRYRAEPV